MTTDPVRFQFFVTNVASPIEPKTTITQIQRVRVGEDDVWYSFPDNAMSPASHPKLMEKAPMKLAVKSLKARGQCRSVTVTMDADLLKIYNDEDGNFVFGEYMLPETRFRAKTESSTEVSELVQSISALATREESVKSILKHFLVEKFSSRSKNVESWCLNFERESERLEISGSRQIEVFKSCLESDMLEWFIVCQNKLGISADWSAWKANLISTFSDVSWYPVAYAYNFKYIAGSYTDYTIKKEKLILELNRRLEPSTILDLIVIGLPDHIVKTLNTTQVKNLEDLRIKLKKFEVEDKTQERNTQQNFNFRNKNNSSTYFGRNFNKRDENSKSNQGRIFTPRNRPPPRRPCKICEKKGMNDRFHPESMCWYGEGTVQKESNKIEFESKDPPPSEEIPKN